MPADQIQQSAETFDWKVYADATCAGLSALIPIPFVDLLFEMYFRRRIPRAVAGRLRTAVSADAVHELGRIPMEFNALQGCLWLPLKIVRYVLRRIWRKIIYVLAVAEAVELVGYYWHRAHLIEHLVQSGRLNGPRSSEDRLYSTFHQVLRDTDTSPLRGVARKVVRSVSRAGRLLMKVRRLGAQTLLAEQRDIILDEWTGVRRQLGHIVSEFERMYLGSARNGD